MHRALIGVALSLLLTAPASAQSNVLTGLPSWKAAVFVPDPAWTPDGLDLADQWCQVNNQVYPTNWGGMQNQIGVSCFAVPHPVSGTWLARTVLRSYGQGTYLGGYEMLVEGRRIDGVETVNRWSLWRYEDGTPILTIGKPYASILNVGSAAKPISLYLGGGSIDVPNGWTQTKVLRLYPNPVPVCDGTNKGRVNYAAGPSGVKDSFAVCAKDATGLYAWRTLY